MKNSQKNLTLMKLIIDDPIPWRRVKPNYQQRRMYEDTEQRKFKEYIGILAIEAMNGKPPVKYPLFAELKIYRNFSPISIHFGDIDNFQKVIFDALNQIAYVDDRQIVKVVAEKIKSTVPRALLTLTKAGA